MKSKTKNNKQLGQTLIETIGAIFILTTALTSALGLTVYVLSNSNTSQNQLIATQLAREGTEVVRMMRDSNWLAGDKKDPDGSQNWGLQLCSDIGKLCYPSALSKIPSYNQYDIKAGNRYLSFTPVTKTWALNNGSSYALYLQSDGSYSNIANGTSIYARKITISLNHNAPYTNSNDNQEVTVTSTVSWTNKHCATPQNNDPSNATSNCKVVVEQHLTNWKDYR